MTGPSGPEVPNIWYNDPKRRNLRHGMTGCDLWDGVFSPMIPAFSRSTIATWERCVMWWPIEGPGSHGPFKGWKGKLWEVAPRWLHVEHLREKNKKKFIGGTITQNEYHLYFCLLDFVCLPGHTIRPNIVKIHRFRMAWVGFLDIYCLFGVCSRGLLEFSWSRPCSFLFVNLLFVEVEMHIFFSGRMLLFVPFPLTDGHGQTK